MSVDQVTAKVLTINNHKGMYTVHRLLYEVSAAHATWQKYIESILCELVGVFVVHDDIIITGSTNEEHLERLRMVFERSRVNELHLNKTKCKFFQKELRSINNNLGYKINCQDILKTPEKIAAILQIPPPTTVKEDKAFLGTFYYKFFKNLSTIAEPLYNLTLI